jgi:hypothetical protein
MLVRARTAARKHHAEFMRGCISVSENNRLGHHAKPVMFVLCVCTSLSLGEKTRSFFQ